MRIAIPVVSVMLTLATMAPAYAGCSTSRFRWLFGSTTSTNMSAGSGQRCGFSLSAGGSTVINGLRIVERPKHGTAFAGSTGVGYQSRPGYRGADTFEFAVIGHGRSGSDPATIRVDVTVQ